jgi:hypothetical protein
MNLVLSLPLELLDGMTLVVGHAGGCCEWGEKQEEELRERR